MPKHKPKRVPKNEEEIFKAFSEQVDFLIQAANLYDSGNRPAIKMATPALRNLFYQQSYGKILIDRISLIDKSKFYSTVRYYPKSVIYTGPVIPETIIPPDSDTASMVYLPNCYDDPFDAHQLNFDQWWDGILFIAGGDTFTRHEMVKFMANQDGGVHVDSGLEQKYSNMVHNLYSGQSMPTGLPTKELNLALMRQIVHETILSFERMHIKHSKYHSGKGSFNDSNRHSPLKIMHLDLAEGTPTEDNFLYF